VAKKWISVPRQTTAAAKATALLQGPLAQLGRTKKVEVNYQLVRWPSTVRQDMGGHAEYGLHVFARAGSEFKPVRLENTPRTDLPPEERTQLSSWVSENLKAIDEGTAVVPPGLLAETTRSVSPKGLARGQNRPFAVLFGQDGEGLGDVSLAGLANITSKKAL